MNISKLFPISLSCLLSCGGLYAQVADSLSFQRDSVYEINEVEISATRRAKPLTGALSGRVDLKIKELQSLPRFLGTVDLLRTIQLIPGVGTNGELNSGLYVRGCESGHNQILFNGATIYNPAHLLGFFSIFNNDHLSSASFSKSGAVPQYGGRLSATLDVSSKEDLPERVSFRGNVGLISSQASVEIPTGKRSGLYVSGRGTYVNLLLGLADMDDGSIQPQYGFQDYNLTYLFRADEKNDVAFNAYFGLDDLSMKEYYYQADGGIRWQNAAVSLRWKRRFDGLRRMEHTAYYSYYNNRIDVAFSGSTVRLPSRIQDIGYRGSYDFRLWGMQWKAGIDYAAHNVLPQHPETEDLFSIGGSQEAGRMRTHEYGLYLQTDIPVASQWVGHVGLRYGGSLQQGSSGAEGGSYDGLEPRLSLDYAWRADGKINLSYALQRQYMNQVVVSGIGLPTDFWLPASAFVPAQYAHSLSLGYVRSLRDDSYEVSVEGYYKYLANQLEFNGELFDMVNQTYRVEEHLHYGEGRTYGVELMVKKNAGRLTGWCSYTIGRSVRSFPAIEGGRSFPAKNDRRHDLSVVANYKINQRWELSGVFVYATGNAFTMPESLYLIGENAINEYGPHNGARMPAYHRMDLSVNWWLRRDSRRESMLNFSLYNAYARSNPIFLAVSVHPDVEKQTLNVSPQGKSLYSLLPSISYSFKF